MMSHEYNSSGSRVYKRIIKFQYPTNKKKSCCSICFKNILYSLGSFTINKTLRKLLYHRRYPHTLHIASPLENSAHIPNISVSYEFLYTVYFLFPTTISYQNIYANGRMPMFSFDATRPKVLFNFI